MYFMKKKIKIYLFILIFMTFLNLFYTFKLANQFSIKTNLLLIIISIQVLISVALFCLFAFLDIKDKKFERLYIYISIFFGFLYLIIIPIGKSPDDVNHFVRAYEIANGKLVSDQAKDKSAVEDVPFQLVDNLSYEKDLSYKKAINNILEKNTNATITVNYSNTALYSFICYIPQVIGIKIGLILKLPILLVGYLGRLTNFIIWIILMCVAIRINPLLKKEIMFISLLPISLQEAVSLSPDAITISCSMLFVSFIMYLMNCKNDKMNKFDYLFLILLSIIISLCKIVYFPLCFLIFLIPKDRFNSKTAKYVQLFILTIFLLFINIVWLKIASRYLIEFNNGVNTPMQIQYILFHPHRYIFIVIKTLNIFGKDYIATIFGRGLSLYDVHISYLYSIIVFLAFILLSLKNDSIYKITKKQKIAVGIIFIIIVALIFTSLYVQWTPYMKSYIEGVQGRYFVPILLLVSILLKFEFLRKDAIDSNCFYIILLLENVIALTTLFSNFI